MAILSTILLLVLALIVTILATLGGLSRMLLRPPRMSAGKALFVLKRMTPSDLGHQWQEITFDIRDTQSGRPLRIAGWWLPSNLASDRTCVLIHGYADAKVGALAWAGTWLSLGYHCLLIDLRAHGESGGELCTGGSLERDDLDQVLDQLLVSHAQATRHLVLFGISLGGAVALAAAARRSDILAVVADSVFADYASAARLHGTLIGAPLPSMLPWAIALAQKRAGVRFDDVRPLNTITAARCPLLLIHGEADPFVSREHVDAIGSALAARKNAQDDHWIVPSAGHCLPLAVDAQGYRERLARFLMSVDRSSETASTRA